MVEVAESRRCGAVRAETDAMHRVRKEVLCDSPEPGVLSIGDREIDGFDMLDDVFPVLLREGSADVSPMRNRLQMSRAELFLGMNESGRVHFTRIVTVPNVLAARTLRRADRRGEPVPEPIRIGRAPACAARFDIGDEKGRAERQASGVHQPVDRSVAGHDLSSTAA